MPEGSGEIVVKDVTTTSFGLIIAYVLPGLVGLYSLTFWSGRLKDISQKFYAAQSDLGLSLMILAAAVVIGLQVNVLRFLIYERILCRTKRIDAESFKKLITSQSLTAFTTVVEENFRYHQFFGSMTLLMPVLYLGLLKHLDTNFASSFWFLVFTGLLTLTEAFLGFLLYEINVATAGLKEFLWCYVGVRNFLTNGIGVRRARRGLSVALILAPIVYLGWLLVFYDPVSNRGLTILVTIGFVILEIATGAGAITALRRYVERTVNILS